MNKITFCITRLDSGGFISVSLGVLDITECEHVCAAHLVFLDGFQQDLSGFAQAPLHLHGHPRQLHGVERRLGGAFRRLHGLLQQRLGLLQVSVATLQADPAEADHGQAWDRCLQGLQDAARLFHLPWANQGRTVWTWLPSSLITAVWCFFGRLVQGINRKSWS